MPRKRILALTPRIPFPPLGGEKLKNYHCLRALTEIYDVDWYSLTEGMPLTGSEQQEFSNFQKRFRSVRFFEQSKMKSIWQTLLGLLGNQPLQVSYFRNSDMQKAVDSHLGEADGAISFLVRTAGYLENYAGPKVLDMTDSISFHYEQAQKTSDSILWKRIYSTEAPRLREFEMAMIQRFDATLFVNKQEADSYGLPGKCVYLPLGVRSDLFDRNDLRKTSYPSASFLGKMNYQPNVEAVQWFCQNVMPSMPSNFRFFIVGAEPAEEVQLLAEKDPRVTVTGFVEDPFVLLQESWVVVAPLRIGGGTQNKVLEAMALGCPVVMTSLVHKPIGCPLDACFVRDTKEEWIEMLRSISNPESVSKVGSMARDWMKTSWGTWDDFEKKFNAAVGKALRLTP